MRRFAEIEPNERQQRLLDALFFFGRFLLAGAVFHALLFWRPDTTPLQTGLASITAAILSMTGVESTSYGVMIASEGSFFEVTQDCLGWKSMAAFLALGFASRLRDYRYAAAGLAVIAVANLLRTVSTLYLAQFVSFDLVHGTLWKWGLTLVTLAAWIYWTAAENRFNLSERLSALSAGGRRTFL